MEIGGLVVVLASGLFTALIGALIRYRGASELIAGYDPEEARDQKGLNEFVGANAIAVGALTMGVGIAAYLGLAEDLAWLAFGLLVIVLTGRLVVGSQRYTH